MPNFEHDWRMKITFVVIKITTKLMVEIPTSMIKRILSWIYLLISGGPSFTLSHFHSLESKLY